SVAARGAIVTGTTLVPNVPVPPPGAPATPFNRDSQSVSVTGRDSTNARAFWIKIDTPLGPYQLFSVDPHFIISGQARTLFTDHLERVFYPGFLQTMTVAAMDSNLYDYYRSGNDPFSGRGLITHLIGGQGVFGAIAVSERRLFDVTQNPVGDPIEGRYTLRSP